MLLQNNNKLLIFIIASLDLILQTALFYIFFNSNQIITLNLYYIYIFLNLFALFAFGNYFFIQRSTFFIILKKTLVATCFSFFIFISSIEQIVFFSDVFILAVHVFLGSFFIRFVLYKFFSWNFFQTKTLIVGKHRIVSLLNKNTRRQHDRRNFIVCAILDLEAKKNTNKIFAYQNNLLNLIKKLNIKQIIITKNENLPKELVKEIKIAQKQKVKVVSIYSFIEKNFFKITLKKTTQKLFDTIKTNNFFTYLFNLIFGFVIFLLAVPILLIAIVLIILNDGYKKNHNIFYSQPRVGLNGKLFTIYKLRTMQITQDNTSRWADKRDARTTLVGKYLRKLHIDEIPQLFNVLKGDMNLVGPRPEQPQMVKKITSQVPSFHLRHRTKPGITGWAQLCFPYSDSIANSKTKLEYDLYYLKHKSVFFDFLILIQTIEVIFFQKGAR